MVRVEKDSTIEVSNGMTNIAWFSNLEKYKCSCTYKTWYMKKKTPTHFIKILKHSASQIMTHCMHALA